MSGSVAASLYTHDQGETSLISLTPSHFACSDTVGRTTAVVMLLIDIKGNKKKTAATKRTLPLKS